MAKIKVAIIGTGNIGTDLCERLLADDRFEVVALIGRRADSEGLMRFTGKVDHLLHEGAKSLATIVGKLDGVFDATSAFDHQEHWTICKENSLWMIDLTPSKIGTPMVPELIGQSDKFVINGTECMNYSMVTCGGQSSAPLVHAIYKHSVNISDIEVSSSIASKSAGPATRLNIDEYIESTENLVKLITNCNSVKSILVLNPAEPPIMMRTTVQVKVADCDLSAIKQELKSIVDRVKIYVPGYEVVVEPYSPSKNVISATVKVSGAGYFLPTYAGNLDIINAAAIETARRYILAKKEFSQLEKKL
jgi:acetaldehyde dehydrogenase